MARKATPVDLGGLLLVAVLGVVLWLLFRGDSGAETPAATTPAASTPTGSGGSAAAGTSTPMGQLITSVKATWQDVWTAVWGPAADTSDASYSYEDEPPTSETNWYDRTDTSE